ncbi:MAG: leucine--tRNA ligase, partial [Thermogutta sp.]|nr:leucine--tRNA ligase [Thermogutta sp.]
PAEQHAKRTGTHPRVTTERNIANFRRQLKMIGFSYDWDREFATTDIVYFRWTQFIFLVIYDTWYDPAAGKGRPISELPIPPEVAAEGPPAVERYRDEHRLAYQSEVPVNWCPALGTVLANEEVVGGVSERGGYPVVRLPLRQWMLRITAYADRLEKDLDLLDWPESVKLLQRNWIGRSVGAEVDFFIGTFWSKPGMPSEREYAGWRRDRQLAGFPRKPDESCLRIYTTRPDTLFGATYMVLAPEHPFVDRLTLPEYADAVRAYREQAARKSDLDRTELSKEKTGVFTGSYAINPVNGQAIPIWIADYVLISYGTGAIMAVPAHDTRDFEFAQQFDLPVVPVVDPGEREDVSRDDVLAGKTVFTAEGTAVNSGDYDGTPTAEFKRRITQDLAAEGVGREAVNYKLRDWVFSRQHFWGEPFPLLHELDARGNPTGVVRALRPEDLPVDLPADMTFDAKHDSPEPPLEKAPPEWLYVTLDGKRYKRETNTMPQWAGSCWYYLRFIDPRNDQALVDPELEKAWMPVDLYVGGAEHAVLHLLYARFWHKVLYDRGYVSTAEPFQKLVNQGMILGEMEYSAFQDPDGRWVDESDVQEIGESRFAHKVSGVPLKPVKLRPDQVEKRGDVFVLKESPEVRVDARAYKMSKSRGNVVNPDDIVREYGADALRLYEMFMGPLESTKPWSMDGVHGVRGFLDRVWRMIVDERAETSRPNPAVQDSEPTPEQARILHRTIREVSRDVARMEFNTAIARLMECVNFFLKQETRPRGAMETFVLLLSPFAPHVAEELWQILGHKESLAYHPWPQFDPELLKEAEIEIPVQVNGKLRGRIVVPAEADAEAMERAAKADPKVAALLEGKRVVKAVVVPKRMVNFVVR